MLAAPFAGTVGSREGILALVCGMARAVKLEADSATDGAMQERLEFLLADLLDAADDLEA